MFKPSSIFGLFWAEFNSFSGTSELFWAEFNWSSSLKGGGQVSDPGKILNFNTKLGCILSLNNAN